MLGLLTCLHDGCAVTAERKKGKYTYYRCTGYRGKCELPYMREEVLAQSLSTVLDGIYVPEVVIAQILAAQDEANLSEDAERERETVRLGHALQALRRKKQQAYEDKLKGSIDEAFWSEQHSRWTEEEIALSTQLARLMQPVTKEQRLSVRRILELANTASTLYKTQNPDQQAKLLRMVLSNCRTDGVNHCAEYRKPFDMIFARAKKEEWRPQRDSNLCCRAENAESWATRRWGHS